MVRSSCYFQVSCFQSSHYSKACPSSAPDTAIFSSHDLGHRVFALLVVVFVPFKPADLHNGAPGDDVVHKVVPLDSFSGHNVDEEL